MVTVCLKEPRTAAASISIWHDTSEAVFRQHIVKLEACTNAVPIDSQVFPYVARAGSTIEAGRRLPLECEQALADDFAAISAVEEGAQSVSAVCVEEFTNPPGLLIRLAAVDTIHEPLRQILFNITKLLSKKQSDSPSQFENATVDILFTTIVSSHYRRILARLRSSKWEKPSYLARSHKKPLWQDFDNLLHRVQFVYLKKEVQARRQVEDEIRKLATLYQNFESIPASSDMELSYTHDLVKSSYSFCKCEAVRLYTLRLSKLPNATSQIASAIKCLYQIEKIAAYWRISKSLLSMSESYPALFSNVKLDYLMPYSHVPTNIAYESWAKSCHVHAEVQLAVLYDHQRTAETFPPRVVGTSKYLCYLCFLFLTYHGRFRVSNTHGRLYDQWTIPDLDTYNHETRERYRCIIREMDNEIVDMTAKVISEVESRTKAKGRGIETGIKRRWKVEPMTSREDLLSGPLE